jgi:cyclophilin family peptidyl-prolyl cis-trans isomerase
MRQINPRVFLSLLVLLIGVSATFAAGKDSTQPRQFKALYAEWKQVLAKLRELTERFQRADENNQAQIESEFNEVAAKARALAPQVTEAAKRAYQAAPNEDAEVGRFLISAVADSLLRDNYEDAYRVGKLLVEHKYNNPEIYNMAGAAAFYVNEYADAREYLTVADKAGQLNDISKRAFGLLDAYEKHWAKEQAIRAAEAKANDLPRVKLETSKGAIVLELFENEAPIATANFISLIEKKFYDGIKFHRVIQGFMAQGGDPTGTGTGGPGYTIPDECRQPDHRIHFRGSLSMAKSEEPDTGGSQFFLTFVQTDHLNGKHTAFGRVVEGMDVLSRLERVQPGKRGAPPNADKIVKATVLRKRPHEYTVPQAKPE